MRPYKSTAATAVAASLALLCGVASAAPRHPHPNTAGQPRLHAHGCRLSLEFKQRVITVGETADAAGQLRCATGELGGQTVTIYERSALSPTFTVAATGTTEKSGAYSIPISGVMYNSKFYAVANEVRSSVKTERVLAEVKLVGPPEGVQLTTLRTGRAHEVTFTGTVTPADEHALVVLQRQNVARGEEWKRIGVGLVGAGGHFEIKHVFRVSGPASIRVVVHAPLLNAPSPSNTLDYEIEQAQNPSLTIDSSADPISYGQSVTISGKVGASGEKVPVGTPVKLFARPPRHPGYTQVAETKTENGEGAYTLPSQSPAEGTLYQTRAAGKVSAVLYEGVKYVLTTSISPGTTVEAGKPLTFSGTVKPGVAGHRVYLERENGAHTAFHVIATGEVVAPEPPKTTAFTFSIEYRFYVLGITKVRIRIPGDPQNGSTASETFTIQVNPAPATSLVSAPPENPTLPSEGQI